MKRFCMGLAALFLLSAAAAAGGEGSDCGGDAYSFAEVVPAQRGARARGALVSVPDTLCADIVNRQASRIESLSVYVDPRRSDTVQGPQAGNSTGKGRPEPRH